MSRGKHTQEQILSVVKQLEAGRKAVEVAREIGVSAVDQSSAHLASHILGRVTSALPGDWGRMYSHPVYFAETFIDPGRFRGTCYRAANWVLMGRTTGRGKASNSYIPIGPSKRCSGWRVSAFS